MKSLSFFVILMLSSSLAFAGNEGHGRDGGWPDSITLLKLAKSNLIELIKQSSDQDVQEAIAGMHDREEYYKPEEITAELLKSFVEAVVEPDVIEIEKSTYQGVRLFYYDNKNPLKPRIYATKNFYNNPKYQVKVSDINISLLKEVQNLILHEVSHLWGFGEETEETNFAEKFSNRMIQILHGANKKSFTQKEKMEGLSYAYFQLTYNIAEHNKRSIVDQKDYHCINIDLNNDRISDEKFSFTKRLSGLDGEEVDEGKLSTIYRMTIDNFVFGETGYDLFMMGKANIPSRYFIRKGGNREVVAYKLCHEDAKKLENYTKQFVAPYYSRSNSLTDFSNSSTAMFRFVFMNRVIESFTGLEEVVKVMNQNQEQIIRNIEYKIKLQMKDDYDWLIARKYKYSKDDDLAIMNKFNQLINADQSTAHQGLYAQIGVNMKKLAQEVDLMKNSGRKVFAHDFILDFFSEFNALVDQTKKLDEEQRFSTVPCGKLKRIGEFYKCFLDTGVSDAKNRQALYRKMIIEAQALIKKYENKLVDFKD